jgi:hypothetical protein
LVPFRDVRRCAVLVLLAPSFVAGCDAPPRGSVRSQTSASTSAHPAASVHSSRGQRVLFEDILYKRVGKPRESRKSFTLPPGARPPFVLVLDYSVDEYSAVVIELNGARVLEGSEAVGARNDQRRVQTEIALSVWEEHELFTRIASISSGYAKIQILGQVAEGRR